MKKVTALLLLLPVIAIAGTHPGTEHKIILSASDMESGASILHSRIEKPPIARGVAELFMFDSEAKVFAVSNAVEYLSEHEEMTVHFRIVTNSLETAESGCRTVLSQMATVIPDLIGDVFVLGDATSHNPDELQRAVMDRTDMLCRVAQIGSDDVVTVRFSFADGSYLVNKKHGAEATTDDAPMAGAVTPFSLEELTLKAEQGDVHAQFELGKAYDHGDGVPKDDLEAVKWYRKAAEQGLREGQYFLGEMYAKGLGVPEDFVEAEKWYRRSAEQGLAGAQLRLGVLYQDGKGVRQDYAKAAEWYRKASEQGDARAQNDLALLYYRGQGVPKDRVKALMWLNVSAAQGHDQSRQNIRIITPRMKHSDISTGEKMAQEWINARTSEQYETSPESKAVEKLVDSSDR